MDGSISTGNNVLSGVSWEPRQVVKGDVARMIFYMATRYEGDAGEPDLELTETLLDNTDKSPIHAKLSTLLEWHLADPVSVAEQNRNDRVYGYQNNRICTYFNTLINKQTKICSKRLPVSEQGAKENKIFTYTFYQDFLAKLINLWKDK